MANINSEIVKAAVDVLTDRVNVVIEDANATIGAESQSLEYRDAAQASADAAAASAATAIGIDDATAADRLATGNDATATASDRAATNQDAIDTAANLAATNQDTLDTAADRSATNQDSIDTAADRVVTEQDRDATNEDAASTASARSATEAARDITLTAKDTTLAAKIAVELIFDTFDDRFLGSKSSEPSTDNDGEALIVGAVYYNSSLEDVFFYNGSTWDSPDTAAAQSASNSAGSASAASTSESNAATSESTATTKASEAVTSASQAQTAKTAAESAEDTALGHKNAASSSQSAAASSASSASSSQNTATTKASEASASASSAASDEASASSSANAASTSETNSAANASTATTKANEAGSSESAASTSASVANAARDATLAALDSFDDRYLGRKSSEPTVDNDGDALLTGSLYFDESSNQMKVYDGSGWLSAYASLDGVVIQANNLSDLDNITAAKSNLELSAVASSGSFDDLSNKPAPFDPNTLGSAAQTDSDEYATAAQGTKVDGIETGATADQTPAELLAAIKTVDINGANGINAGTIGGLALSSNSMSSTVAVRNNAGDIKARLFRSEYDNTNPTIGFIMTQVDTGGNNYIRPSTPDQVKTSLGLDQDVSTSGTPSFGSTLNLTGSSIYLKMNDTTADADDFFLHVNSSKFYILTDRDDNGAHDSPHPLELVNSSAEAYLYGHKVWTAGNDGAGSGLDADTVDGLNASDFARYSDAGNISNSVGPAAFIATYADANNIDHIWHDESTNTWSFCSDVGFKAEGNSTLKMGNIVASGDVTASSDIRVKENLTVIPNALEKVCQLSGYTFDRTDPLDHSITYKHNPNNRYLGLVAQEVLKVLPEAVRGGPSDREGSDDDHYSVAYGNVVALLVEAIKTLSKEVEELKGASLPQSPPDSVLPDTCPCGEKPTCQC